MATRRYATLAEAGGASSPFIRSNSRATARRAMLSLSAEIVVSEGNA
jgi:hypothetical protein